MRQPLQPLCFRMRRHGRLYYIERNPTEKYGDHCSSCWCTLLPHFLRSECLRVPRKTLQPFKIQTMALLNPGNAQILADINARLGRGLTDWAPWTSIIELYGNKITEWSERYGPAYTEEMGNFFLSWPGVGSTDRDDGEWICQGLLGKGGFGMVGHWLRPDAAGVIIDVGSSGPNWDIKADRNSKSRSNKT
jgi:hypothetical protein